MKRIYIEIGILAAIITASVFLYLSAIRGANEKISILQDQIDQTRQERDDLIKAEAAITKELQKTKYLLKKEREKYDAVIHYTNIDSAIDGFWGSHKP